MACISVIVPVYKVEPYLNRCVDSILAQSCRDFVLVLVDDGSPDGCGAICDGYARQDSRIHVIHQENGGLSAARNAGIRWTLANTDTDWLTFVDSDDWIHRAYLQRLLDAVETSGCLLSVCGYLSTAGEPLPEAAEGEVTVLSAEDYYCGERLTGTPAVTWNKMYHRSLFATLRFPAGKLHEDEFTTYRAVYQARQVAVIPVPLYAYYQNSAGIMAAAWSPRRMDVLEACRQQMAFAREQGYPRLLHSATRQWILTIHEQLHQAPGKYRIRLRNMYRHALKAGRDNGTFPRTEETVWAYEEAYPCKIFWWIRNRLKRGGKR